MTVWNFTFGSHLSPDQLQRVLAGFPLDAVPATLSGYRLTFWALRQFPKAQVALAAGGGPALLPDPRGVIHGAAYLLTQAQFERVDRYETEWGYRLFHCTVDTPNGPLQALAHNLTDPQPFVPPAAPFLKCMTEGLAAHGYGQHEIQAVKRAAKWPEGDAG